MASFTVRYYSDIVRHHKTAPCAHHGTVYPTAEQAEAAACHELQEVRKVHGRDVGFAIFEDNGRVVAIGPATQ